jgi:MoxR-like ATPase
MTPEERVQQFRQIFSAIEKEVGQVIVGQRDPVRKMLIAFFAGGHILIEGVPGLGKTLTVKSISEALGLSFKRIQFTPDLMPSDIVGTQILAESDHQRYFEFKKGPIFANIILADEINRATPKAQSAVLEAMEEQQVTVFGETHKLTPPFFILATQNPLELEGTYPLPEAQMDRFFFKVVIHAPSPEELKVILNRTTYVTRYQIKEVLPLAKAPHIVEAMKALVREVFLAPPLEDYLVRFVTAATPGSRTASFPEVNEYFRFGPSPRGAQALTLGAKVNALLDGRVNVSYEDIADVVLPALRHRCLLNFQAEAENVMSDQILEMLLKKVPRN